MDNYRVERILITFVTVFPCVEDRHGFTVTVEALVEVNTLSMRTTHVIVKTRIQIYN